MTGRTAAEVQAELEERYRTDAEYRVVVDERRAAFQARAAERTRKLVPFRDALLAAGVTETSDRMTGVRYADPRIFEVAFEHLAQPGYDDETRAAIARSFERRGAGPYWARIQTLYLTARSEIERDALAAALSTSAKAANVGAMKRMVQTEELGSSRIMFLRPINRLDRKGGRDFVLELLDDPVLGVEADRIRRRVSRNS